MNSKIKNLTSEILSDTIYSLKKYSFDYNYSGENTAYDVIREVYDHGDGACVLLYNKEKKTVILTRQFRLPTYLNQNMTGYLIEVCAGSLDGDSPEDCAKKEALEETGYQIKKVEKVLTAYASPAVMTEIAHLFIAEYTDAMKLQKGGGLEDEDEYIEVLEMLFDDVYKMIEKGEIQDARTIMLVQHLKIKNIL